MQAAVVTVSRQEVGHASADERIAVMEAVKVSEPFVTPTV
jgi:hypothetical protein